MDFPGPGLLTGKVVLVSGVGPGLGTHVVHAIARHGAAVVCVARTASYVEQVAEEIAAADGTAFAVPGDITVEADCERIAQIIETTCGRLDGIVNSAFTAGKVVPFAECDLSVWRETMEVNLFGTLALISKNLPLLERDGGAAIINVNTHSAIRPMMGQGAYGASKAALEFATRQLALELGKSNIRLNTVYCGPMMGPNLKSAMHFWAAREKTTTESIQTKIAARIALGRIPEDEEPADLIVTLLSDYARVVTGAAIVASGGAFLDNHIT